jgi:hypothetical protein
MRASSSLSFRSSDPAWNSQEILGDAVDLLVYFKDDNLPTLDDGDDDSSSFALLLVVVVEQQRGGKVSCPNFAFGFAFPEKEARKADA